MPAITVPPPQIPPNVLKVKRYAQAICVFFFGSHSYGWVVASRIHPYNINGIKLISNNPSKDNNLNKAIDEATAYYNNLINVSMPQASNAPAESPPYEWIRSNKIPRHLQRFVKSDLEVEVCDCNDSDPTPCGINSYCLNHLCYVECADTCRLGARCQNQNFKNGVRVEVEVLATNGKGLGLFAKQRIPANSFVIEYVGEIIDQCEWKNREQILNVSRSHQYFLKMNSVYIDAMHYGNESRFINHSCDPNTLMTKWTVDGECRIGIFATRDIECVGFRN